MTARTETGGFVFCVSIFGSGLPTVYCIEVGLM